MFDKQKMDATSSSRLRLIVIDDDIEYCDALKEIVEEELIYSLDVVNTIKEFRIKLKEAEAQGKVYAIAIIDMNLSPGDAIVRRTGQEAIKIIKTHHPYIGCIMASGALSGDIVLRLRDDYDLDTYISKANITAESLEEQIQKALQRVRSQQANKQKLVPTLPSSSNVVTLDFHLDSAGASITWRSTLTGREQTPFNVPYDEQQLRLVIRALDVLQYPDYPIAATAAEERYFSFSLDEQQILQGVGLWQADRISTQAAAIVGQALFTALGSEGQRMSKALRNASSTQRSTTQYVLRFPREAISLAALPWELSWDIDRNQAILIRGNTIDSCERYIDIDMAIPPPLPGGQRPHLLALAPVYNIPDDIRQSERAARLETWERLQQDNKITYDEISPLTMRKLNNYLLKMPARPDVIHFFGHGIYRNGKGYLLFDTDAGGRDLVSAERLASVLGDVRLVVIHACQSAMIDTEGSLLTGVAPALSMETGAVVAMQLTVRIESAMRFSEVFYDELLSKGRSLQDSVARARQILYSESGDGSSWYVPTLYIRSRDPQPVYLVTDR